MRLLSVVVPLLALATLLPAQVALPDLLSTAGTTATDPQGRPWGYVVWSPGSSLGSGRTYAVFLKPALPTAPGDFARVGVVQRTTDPLVLNTLLARGATLGEFAAKRDSQLRELYAWLRGRDAGDFTFPAPAFGQPQPDPALVRSMQSAQFQAQLAASASLTPAQRLGGLMQRALTEGETAATLQQMGALYPSVGMAHGFAWGGPLGVAAGTTVTIEIREWDPVGATSLAVVGRVILVAGQPEILPPPGAPVQLPESNPKGDLNIKLRWSTPDGLRLRALLARGHNLYRVPAAVARARGWDAAAPTLAALQAESATRLANPSAILTAKLFGAGDVGAFSGPGSDATTFYYADDNHRFLDTNADGQPDGVPFVDGEEFFYFATTRDLLGRESAPSAGGWAEAIRRLPPDVPAGLAVEALLSTVDPAGNPYAGNTGRQLFRIGWKPNADRAAGNGLPADLTTEYEIYRLDDIALLQTRAGQETLDGIGPFRIVSQAAGTQLSVLDDALDPVADAGRTIAYSLRAVYRRTPASPPVRSGFSPPVFGTLRSYDGPPAPEAWVEVNRARAAVRADGNGAEPLTVPVPATDRVFRLRVTSRDLQADYAEFRVLYQDANGEAVAQELGRHEFADGDAVVETEFTLPVAAANSDSTLIFCRVGNNSGAISRAALRDFATHPGEGLARIVRWQTGELSDATLDPADPLAATLIAQTAALSGATRGSFPTFYPQSNALTPPVAAPSNPAVRATVTGLGWGPGTEVAVQRFDGGAGVWNYLAPATVRALAAGGAAVYFFDPVLNFELGALGTYRGLRLRSLEAGEVTAPLFAARDTTGQPTAGGGMTTQLRLCGEAREFRLYRQVGDGPLTLVAQGTAAPGADGCAQVSYTDAMPGGSCALRRSFAQVFDRHGNASPLVKAGEAAACDTALPVPRLEQPEPGGTVAAPTVKLRWFCPAPGIERFEFGASAKTDVIGSVLPLNSAAVTPIAQPAGSTLKIKTKAGDSVIGKTFFRYLTPKLGGPLFPQAGPVFTLEIPVVPNREYQFTVAAHNAQGSKGKRSPLQKFVWKLPGTPADLRIPWPARPLPPVAPFHPLIAAVAFPLPTSNADGKLLWPGTSDEYPIGVRIARTAISGGTEDYRIRPDGTPVLVPLTGSSPARTMLDFNQQVFRRDANTPLLPIALYRRQVASSFFPQVSGNVVQCSPLLEDIRWEANNEFGSPGARLIDPHVGFVPITIGAQRFLDLFLLDTQPVAAGAQYQYFLVRFHPQTREMEQVIEVPVSAPSRTN